MERSMRRSPMKKLLSGILAISFAVAPIASVQAAPVFVPKAQSPATVSDVIQVESSTDKWRWRRMNNLRRDWSPGWSARSDWRRDWRDSNWRRSDWRRSDWRRDWRDSDWRRSDWRRSDWRRSHWRDNDYRYWRGHRGYRYYRPGYRRYDGFWFPAAAFITGAIIGGALNQPVRRVYRGGDAHVQWCYNRYRSYRAYDNTYQPYNGPRRQCYSPYS
jgi:hypothetical protein